MVSVVNSVPGPDILKATFYHKLLFTVIKIVWLVETGDQNA